MQSSPIEIHNLMVKQSVCVITQAHLDLKDPQEREASKGFLASRGPLDFQEDKGKVVPEGHLVGQISFNH